MTSASTASEHGAIARIYEGQAREARSAAQQHRWQALTEQLHQLGTVESFNGTCAAIARDLRGKAALYDKLASDHRELAKLVPSN